MGIKVEVDKVELEKCIKRLNTLYEECYTSDTKESITSKGKTKEKLEDVKNEYEEIKKEIRKLVKAIIDIMETAKTGSVELDESYDRIFSSRESIIDKGNKNGE